MAIVAEFPDGLDVTGHLVPTSFTWPADSITKDEDFRFGDAVAATKIVRRHRIQLSQPLGWTTAVFTIPIYVVLSSSGATLKAFQVVFDTGATGANKWLLLDLQLSNAGGAFGSVLSAPILIDNEIENIRKPISANIETTALTQNDVLQIKVTDIGTTTSTGLNMIVEIDETP